MFKAAGHGWFFTVTFRIVPRLPARNWGAQMKVWTCVTGVVEIWICSGTYCTILHLKYQVGLGELSGAIMKQREKKPTYVVAVIN